jgi:hypothetical protein
MKTKPFSLEKALAGHPVVTSDGRRVIQMAYFPACPMKEFALQVLIDGENYPLAYREDGKKYRDNTIPGYNLLLEVKTVKRYARVIRRSGEQVPEFSFLNLPTREKAEVVCSADYEVLPAYEYEIEE